MNVDPHCGAAASHAHRHARGQANRHSGGMPSPGMPGGMPP